MEVFLPKILKKMMKNDPLLFRFHTGSLDDSMKTLVSIDSKEHLIGLIRDKMGIDILPINSSENMFDPSICWNTHIVTAKYDDTHLFPIGFLSRKPDWLQEES